MMINTAMTGINADDACEAYNIVVYWPQLACTHTSGMYDANEAVSAANYKKNEVIALCRAILLLCYPVSEIKKPKKQ